MSLVRPWRRERAITDVDVDELAASGVRCVLFDRDNTVVPRDTGVAPESVMDWILSRARGGYCPVHGVEQLPLAAGRGQCG